MVLPPKQGLSRALLAERGFTSPGAFLEPGAKKNFYELFYHGSYWPWLP